MYEDFKPFIDKFGLIAQKDTAGADGGDSAHRFGVLFSCLKILKHKTWVSNDRLLSDYYFFAMSNFEKDKDTYVRHPDKTKWYSNPLNFSRDQTTMIIKAMLVMGDGARVRGIAKEIFKNFGFHKNIYPNYAKPGDAEYKKKVADIVTPSQIADFLRSYRKPILYPILCVLDLFKFADIYLAKKDDEKSKAKGKRTDYYVMLATDVIVSRYVQDTFVMRAVARLLAKSDYRSSIKWIFSPQFDDPPIDQFLLAASDKFIEKVD